MSCRTPSRCTRFAVAVVVFALFMALSGTAFAIDAQEYQLQLIPVSDIGESLLIVSALLPPDASLPASITIPVPAGSSVLWTGEILGGAVEDDPTRIATIVREGTMDLHTFTVEQSRLAQIEIAYPAPKISGRTVSSSVTWTNPGAEVLVSGSVIVEPGAASVDISPAPASAPEANDLGETLYDLGGLRLKTGGSYVLSASWKRASTTTRQDVMVWLVVALVVAAVALGAAVVAQRTRARRAATSGE